MKPTLFNRNKSSEAFRMSERALLTSWKLISGLMKLNYGRTKSNLLKSMALLVVVPEEINTSGNGPISYVIGSIIALIILGFLVYSLLKPDNF
jgi:K+-transporting ATPase KdpF subunit